MRFPENVHHLLASGEKVVGNDPAVAAPPDRFSAHDRAAVLTASFPEPGHNKSLQGSIWEEIERWVDTNLGPSPTARGV